MNGLAARAFVIDLRPLVRDGLKARLRTAPGMVVAGEAQELDEAVQQPLRSADIYLVDSDCCGSGGKLAAFVERVAPAVVLVLASGPSSLDVQKYISAGAKGVMLKDAPTEELLAAVSTLLGGGAYLGPGIHAEHASEDIPDAELSPRELEVLQLVGRGLPSKSIAKVLGLSVRTVESHRLNAKRKLQLRTNGELIKFAVEKVQAVSPGKTLRQ